MGEGNEPRQDDKPPGAPVDDPVVELAARLGIPLPDAATALAALTHKSYVNEHRDEAGLTDNERLEFLGDAVIDLAVSHRLMERFPGAREGDLSKMRAAVVDEQGLSEMARALDLGSLLRLGRGEELTGGRKKASLLADAMEAVVAALYLGGGLAAVLSLIDRFLGEAFDRATAGTLDRDFKTQLQELAQSQLRSTPRYRVVGEHGPDHSKTFEVETDLRGEVLGRGAGRSKKDAEQAAAKLALDQLVRRSQAANGGAPPVIPAATREPELPVVTVAWAEPDPAPQLDPPAPEAPSKPEPPAAPAAEAAAASAPRPTAKRRATRARAAPKRTRAKPAARARKVPAKPARKGSARKR